MTKTIDHEFERNFIFKSLQTQMTMWSFRLFVAIKKVMGPVAVFAGQKVDYNFRGVKSSSPFISPTAATFSSDMQGVLLLNIIYSNSFYLSIHPKTKSLFENELRDALNRDAGDAMGCRGCISPHPCKCKFISYLDVMQFSLGRLKSTYFAQMRRN